MGGVTSLRPGDEVTCSSCGAQGRAWATAPERWREGDAVLVTWTNGPHPRHDATKQPPDLCLWCDDRRLGFPTLLGRPLPGEAPWVAGGPGCTFEIPPVVMHQRSAGEGPLNAGPEDVREDARPRPRLDGNKAPLERPDPKLATSCPWCGAPAGEPCRNYLGKAKQACPERGAPAAAAPPAPPAAPALAQLDLFGGAP